MGYLHERATATSRWTFRAAKSNMIHYPPHFATVWPEEKY
jgi:hypothetical protein